MDKNRLSFELLKIPPRINLFRFLLALRAVISDLEQTSRLQSRRNELLRLGKG